MAVCGYAIYKNANAKEKSPIRSGWLFVDMQNLNTPRRKQKPYSPRMAVCGYTKF